MRTLDVENLFSLCINVYIYMYSARVTLEVVHSTCRHSTDREVALMILMAYLSYVMAAMFDLSEILTVFFCGIVMSHYTWHNVTANSKVTTRSYVIWHHYFQRTLTCFGKMSQVMSLVDLFRM